MYLTNLVQPMTSLAGYQVPRSANDITGWISSTLLYSYFFSTFFFKIFFKKFFVVRIFFLIFFKMFFFSNFFHKIFLNNFSCKNFFINFSSRSATSLWQCCSMYVLSKLMIATVFITWIQLWVSSIFSTLKTSYTRHLGPISKCAIWNNGAKACTGV